MIQKHAQFLKRFSFSLTNWLPHQIQKSYLCHKKTDNCCISICCRKGNRSQKHFSTTAIIQGEALVRAPPPLLLPLAQVPSLLIINLDASGAVGHLLPPPLQALCQLLILFLVNHAVHLPQISEYSRNLHVVVRLSI